jgi:hypothetical protein
MSFILNALKKAEQDRLRDDPKDLEDFASARWDPYEQKPSSNKPLIVFSALMLLVLSVLVLFYLIDDTGIKQNNPVVNAVEINTEPTIDVSKSVVVTQTQPIDPMAIPLLNISGHMFFAQGSSSNRLFANDQSFKEGDLVANGWVLVVIQLDGIKLKKNDRLEFIPYP